MLCNGKNCFSLDPIQEVTLIISLPQEENCKLLHNRMEENVNRGRVKKHSTEHSTKTEKYKAKEQKSLFRLMAYILLSLLKEARIYVNSLKIQVICF